MMISKKQNKDVPEKQTLHYQKGQGLYQWWATTISQRTVQVRPETEGGKTTA